ncbi:HemK family Modification methylase [Thecamonas trahens ATCC 50062]|uniref:HemK family Modification methylase n=1 Tax=Thecamonas trahens ATCC 50062 TaxID=461836 RepID=A0A0L0DF10_THETB|nr:HemK family Modification methylase [Thecamonas trahens ATCC 50062]KNC50726.1 HemK family Modification methylase [Thecamonas trahens ATCC 50062]|eukprot:XP_013756694.1 HemK family Modification methylase [Thecamonas trahens ATCC 50062]
MSIRTLLTTLISELVAHTSHHPWASPQADMRALACSILASHPPGGVHLPPAAGHPHNLLEHARHGKDLRTQRPIEWTTLSSLSRDLPLPPSAFTAAAAAIAARSTAVPVPYITGFTEFGEHLFRVASPDGDRVLVPRPASELLVERATKALTSLSSPAASVLELGVGSGAVLISVAAAAADLPRPVAAVGVDVAPAALRLAEVNAQAVAVDAKKELDVSLLASSWMTELLASPATFDVIISNPPYLCSHEIGAAPHSPLAHEPRGALDGGEHGRRRGVVGPRLATVRRR